MTIVWAVLIFLGGGVFGAWVVLHATPPREALPIVDELDPAAPEPEKRPVLVPQFGPAVMECNTGPVLLFCANDGKLIGNDEQFCSIPIKNGKPGARLALCLDHMEVIDDEKADDQEDVGRAGA